MKRVFLLAIMLIGLAFSGQAQSDTKNALGVRLGDNNGFGGELSYQRDLMKNNRLELDLGLRSSYSDRFNYDYKAAKLIGIYQWVFNIDNGFKWYVGPGVGVGLWNTKRYYDYNDNFYIEGDSGSFAILTGDIGIEYNFPFPLQLSFDFRPEIYISSDYNDIRDDSFGPDFGLSARFRF